MTRLDGSEGSVQLSGNKQKMGKKCWKKKRKKCGKLTLADDTKEEKQKLLKTHRALTNEAYSTLTFYFYV